MKLRLRGNSVRVRLTRAEVAALGNGQTVSQITAFSPTDQLVSSTGASEGAKTPGAAFVDGAVRIVLPLAQARHWAHSEEVTLSAAQPVGAGESLALVIEKDFECLHHPDESVDAFPNPRFQQDRPPTA